MGCQMDKDREVVETEGSRGSNIAPEEEVMAGR